jgi:hypothetical protein
LAQRFAVKKSFVHANRLEWKPQRYMRNAVDIGRTDEQDFHFVFYLFMLAIPKEPPGLSLPVPSINVTVGY